MAELGRNMLRQSSVQYTLFMFDGIKFYFVTINTR